MACVGKVEPFGIVTLADAAYFPGLEMLYRSVQESWPIPVACFDAGLTKAQKRAARQYPLLRILDLPSGGIVDKAKAAFREAAPLRKKNKRVWPLWICPALIAAAPFERVFWLDCDVVVLRDLRGLFALLDDGPVFTPENNAPEQTPNSRELYALLPIERQFDPCEPRINAGVTGWDKRRDAEALAAYASVVAAACDHEAVRQAVSWHDQGALIWAIQKCGLEDRVLTSWQWNLCVRRTTLAKRPLPFDGEFLSALREILPETNLLHWNGTKPPWDQISRLESAASSSGNEAPGSG